MQENEPPNSAPVDAPAERAVLIEHEKHFSEYAQRHNVNWSRVTMQP